MKAWHPRFSLCSRVLVAGAAGCKVQVDKSSDGDNVKIATPFGGISVNKDQTSAAEIGLPAYPGSVVDTGGDGNKSAKVDMGFGSFKLRVKVANYSTADNRDQVLAFYRNALSEYGNVIECARGQAGRPTGRDRGRPRLATTPIMNTRSRPLRCPKPFR